MDKLGFSLTPGLDALHPLFKRCLQCPDEQPSCPTCKDEEVCSFIQKSCFKCASAVCIPASETSTSGPSTSGGGTNIGAIAGGVVGGIVFIIIVSFLLWKYWFKGKRRAVTEDYEFAEEKSPTEAMGIHRSARMSTHTMQSMASTVLTRASNIIQIAYIPGVTNRQTASPGLLVPPVPPIPSASPATSPYKDNTDEQVFFTAGDIRDSSYSSSTTAYAGTYQDHPRDSIAPSLARSSITSAVYKATAQVSPLPAPTQRMIRGNVKMVNVPSPTTTTNSPVDGPAYYNRLNSASGSSGSRTIQVRMPASTDALGGTSNSSSMRSLRGVKPVPLNLGRKLAKKAGPDNGFLTNSIADAISRAAQDDPQGHGGVRDSVADSMVSHSRARRIDEAEIEDESTDDDAAGNAHERSRRSLLKSRDKEGPFTDHNRVNSVEEVPMLQSYGGQVRPKDDDDDDNEHKQSPFEDARPS